VAQICHHFVAVDFFNVEVISRNWEKSKHWEKSFYNTYSYTFIDINLGVVDCILT